MKINLSLFMAIFMVMAFSAVFAAENDAASQELIKNATDAFNNKDFASAEKYYQEIIRLNPNVKELYYNLAVTQFQQGKDENAAANLYKAIDLGYTQVPPELEMALRPYKYREFSVSLGREYTFSFKGSSNCSDQLIRDILPGIGIYTGGIDKIDLIKPKFLRWGPEGKYWEEEWVAEGKEGTKTFSLTLTPTPDGGSDYHIKLKQ